MINKDISIRSVQHWLYCPHRWGLLEIECAWAENYYVTKSNLLHKRIHENNSYISKTKKSYTGVTVYNDLPEYGLYGIVDCLEFNGTKYTLVEYKPTKPKNTDYNHDDLMQVFAQKICTDYVFGCDCEGVIYYADVKKRIKLPIKEKYNECNDELLETLSKMRDFIIKGKIPTIKKGQKCNGCSMKDLCMPKIKGKENLKETIKKILETEI